MPATVTTGVVAGLRSFCQLGGNLGLCAWVAGGTLSVTNNDCRDTGVQAMTA